MNEPEWDICGMCGPMVRCGYCGNNCCNGGTGESGGVPCFDKCATAYAMQRAEEPPPELAAKWREMKLRDRKWRRLQGFES